MTNLETALRKYLNKHLSEDVICYELKITSTDFLLVSYRVPGSVLYADDFNMQTRLIKDIKKYFNMCVFFDSIIDTTI
jgi:hypothetical protein